MICILVSIKWLSHDYLQFLDMIEAASNCDDFENKVQIIGVHAMELFIFTCYNVVFIMQLYRWNKYIAVYLLQRFQTIYTDYHFTVNYKTKCQTEKKNHYIYETQD